MPRQVYLALVLLWLAWLISVSAWLVHSYAAVDRGADLYAMVGFPAALIQAVLVYLIGKRNNIARLLVVVVAIPAFIVVQIFFSERVAFSALRLGVEALMRGTAVILLLTPASSRWFRRL